jgi:hypothetical protein
MNINNIKTLNSIIIKEKDNTCRNISYCILNDVLLTGRNLYYPNVLLYNNLLYSPYDEKIMSLNKDCFYDNNIFDFVIEPKNTTILYPVYFFIYNFDNYYHFLYDTLPYIYHFLHLKKIHNNLKLLVNYPNKNMNTLYKFNEEFLYKFIDKNDIIIHDNNNIYKTIYVGNSLTHGGYSNNPPRPEVYEIMNILIKNTKIPNNIKKINNIYISRRTWINKDITNIGTNYTTRRKMMNEDELVEKLKERNFVEIFAENLSTDEKIYLFNNAEIIVGSIGGGMANLLFSKKTTKTIIILTPFFLDINYRFKYSLENTNYTYFNDVELYGNKKRIPLFCRVQVNNKIGEIVEYLDEKYIINLSNNDVAGFNNTHNFEKGIFKESELKLLDNGLNSPYVININKLIDSL